MTQNYKIKGMTCSGCQAKVRGLLEKVGGVKTVDIDLERGLARIETDHSIPTGILQAALQPYPKYSLSELTEKLRAGAEEVTAASEGIAPQRNAEMEVQAAETGTETMAGEEEQKSRLATYKPVLLIFGYLFVLSMGLAWRSAGADGPDYSLAMRVFMGGFFLVFSFFKLLDLRGFAESYAMYDIVARRFGSWGYIYAFIELALGFAFVFNFNPRFTNASTLLVMTVSLIGVLQSVLNKKKIKCACLGAVFNLPMSTVTIIEDGLMIVMSGLMLASVWQ